MRSHYRRRGWRLMTWGSFFLGDYFRERYVQVFLVKIEAVQRTLFYVCICHFPLPSIALPLSLAFLVPCTIFH